MPAQVLVMCEACGRPQFATQPTCVACGAKLPDVPATKAQLKSAREQVLDSYEPFLEADFGRGRLLLLSEKQLQWRAGAAAPWVADLAKVDTMGLRKRPVWETALPAGLIALAAIWPATGWGRAVLAGLAALWLVAGAVQRRCALVVRMKDGRRAAISLGIGRPALQRADSVWATMTPELLRLGVTVES